MSLKMHPQKCLIKMLGPHKVGEPKKSPCIKGEFPLHTCVSILHVALLIHHCISMLSKVLFWRLSPLCIADFLDRIDLFQNDNYAYSCALGDRGSPPLPKNPYVLWDPLAALDHQKSSPVPPVAAKIFF